VRAVVVYESMYGNTHAVAEAIGAGLSSAAEVTVLATDIASVQALAGIDLLVVGGPTHAHGLSRVSTRRAAIDAAHKPDADLTVDPDAEGPGLREWFDTIEKVPPFAAAFDTRADMSPVLSGRASKGIAKRLRHHGGVVLESPESFLVTKDNHLAEAEVSRARAWGAKLAADVVEALHP
jgi:menaquinone-dependent protoporphyrinogen IX oxidase